MSVMGRGGAVLQQLLVTSIHIVERILHLHARVAQQPFHWHKRQGASARDSTQPHNAQSKIRAGNKMRTWVSMRSICSA